MTLLPTGLGGPVLTLLGSLWGFLLEPTWASVDGVREMLRGERDRRSRLLRSTIRNDYAVSFCNPQSQWLKCSLVSAPAFVGFNRQKPLGKRTLHQISATVFSAYTLPFSRGTTFRVTQTNKAQTQKSKHSRGQNKAYPPKLGIVKSFSGVGGSL